MSWKHRRIPICASYKRLLQGVMLLALANGDSPEIALFSRTTACRRHRVLLLTPEAVRLAGDALPEEWGLCEAPELFEWDRVFGADDACERFGLTRTCIGRSRLTPPMIFGRPAHGSPG